MPPTPVPVSPSIDRETLTFLREEAAANRTTLRDEAEANRKLLSDTLRIAAYPLAVIIAVAGFFGWKSLSDLRQSVQDEAKQQTQAEVLRMQEEIRTKLKAEFETPQLQKMVREAATAQTGAVLLPLIEKEVSANVSRSVAAQQPTIHSTIVSETHKAVDALKPDIDSIVNSRVNDTVDKSVDKQISTKVQPVLTQLQSSQQMADLVTRAQTGDGNAFDQMTALAMSPTTQADLKESMLRGALDILNQHNHLHAPLQWIEPHTDEQSLQHLHDPDARARQTVLDTLPLDVLRKHLDELLSMMMTDPDLTVREAGFVRFNQLMLEHDSHNHVDNLDSFGAQQYFRLHRQEMLDGKKASPIPAPSGTPTTRQ